MNHTQTPFEFERILIEYVVWLPFLVSLIVSAFYVMQKRAHNKYYHIGKWLAYVFTIIFFFISMRVRMMEELPIWFTAIALTVAILTAATSIHFFTKAFAEHEDSDKKSQEKQIPVQEETPYDTTPKVTLSPEEIRDLELEGFDQYDKLAVVYERLTNWMKNEQAFLKSSLRVDDVARAVGINKTYLIAALKEYEDCTFVNYVSKLRIEYAKHYLLSHPREKLTSVSLSCGFASTEVFCRVFKNVTGITPSQFKDGKRTATN